MVKKHVPSCLVVIEYMTIHEMLKVFVVNVDCDHILNSLKQIPPILKCIDDSQKQFVMNFMIYFGHLNLP
jgi:hypothetical protein